MVHRRGAEDAEGEFENKKLCELCASVMNPAFRLWLRLCCATISAMNRLLLFFQCRGIQNMIGLAGSESENIVDHHGIIFFVAFARHIS